MARVRVTARPRPLSRRSGRMLRYLRAVRAPVSVRFAIEGSGLSRPDGYAALTDLLERGEVSMRLHPELGEVVRAVGRG